MTNVFLLSTFADPGQDVHWASPYLALRKAFTQTSSPYWRLVQSPEDADLILICPRARNPVFPIEVFRGGIAWRHRHKCVVISTDDNPTWTHKGFYTSLRAGAVHSPWLKGGFYPLVTYAAPHEPFPVEGDFSHLFSFLGSYETHTVRQRIGALATRGWREHEGSFLVRDTSQRGRGARGVQQDDVSFRREYLDAMRCSKFILCPRGMCPSTLRLFETLKARRVPVVISDEWVRPPEIAWDRFAIIVREKDVHALPTILAGEESSFADRAHAARRAWEQHFEEDVLADTVTKWGSSLVAESTTKEHRREHLGDLWGQVLRWRFVRRGLLSEFLRLAGAGA